MSHEVSQQGSSTLYLLSNVDRNYHSHMTNYQGSLILIKFYFLWRCKFKWYSLACHNERSVLSAEVWQHRSCCTPPDEPQETHDALFEASPHHFPHRRSHSCSCFALQCILDPWMLPCRTENEAQELNKCNAVLLPMCPTLHLWSSLRLCNLYGYAAEKEMMCAL